MKWMIFKKLFLLLGLAGCLSAFSQDLFDYNHSKEFADHLYRTKKYDFATKEYQRVLFLNHQDTSAWLNLIASYHHQKQFTNASFFLDSAEVILGSGIKSLGKLRIYNHLKASHFSQIEGEIHKYSFSPSTKKFMLASSHALSGNWAYFNTHEHTESYWLNNLNDIAKVAAEERYKKPFLAGLLSSILPGSGKAYTGRWKDGIFSLILVGTTAWQASRFISRKGILNPGSIFFSGFAVGLYAGNIYGSVKSAKDYNLHLDRRNYEKANHLVDMYFGY